MWIALYIAGGLVALVIVLNLVGLCLPRDHVVARKATFARPADTVWDAMTSLATDFAAKEKLPMEVEVDERPRRRVTRIVDAKLPFGGRWVYELAPQGDATTLTITEAGFVKIPMLRIFTSLAPHVTMTKFLRALGDQLGAPAPAEPAVPAATASGR